MEKKFRIDFSGSLYLPNINKDADVAEEFFKILNSYNATHDPQFQCCEISEIKEVSYRKRLE